LPLIQESNDTVAKKAAGRSILRVKGVTDIKYAGGMIQDEQKYSDNPQPINIVDSFRFW